MAEGARHRRRVALALALHCTLGASIGLAPSCTEEPPTDGTSGPGRLRYLELSKQAGGGYHSQEGVDWQLVIRMDGQAELHDLTTGTTQVADLGARQFDALVELANAIGWIELEPYYFSEAAFHLESTTWFKLTARLSDGTADVEFTSRDGPPQLHELAKRLEEAKDSAGWQAPR